MRLMQGASWALIVASILYVGTIVYGVMRGDALPTATVFRLLPYARSITGLASYVPLGIIAFAAVGAALSWLTWLELMPGERLRQLEISQARLWRIWGLPVLLCLLLFTLSAGGWSGYYHSTNMNYMSIGGLVSNSDGGNYFKETFHLAYFGDWEVMGTRRPMAEAFRELITVPVDYSYSASLLVQLVIVAVMLYLASLLLAGWYGVWVGIGFAGLAFNIARPFLSTTMTEPLGYIWGLFALVFFIQSVKLRSLPHALLALAALTVAMMMRMGALLAIPFMVLWVGYAFAQGFGSRLRLITIASSVVLAVVAVNVGLQRFYGQAGVDTGGNFAWTTCGLSIGQGWQACDALYKAKLYALPDERMRSFFLFVETWRNFVAHPSVLILQLAKNFAYYLSRINAFLLAGYLPLFPPDTGESDLFLLPLLVGAITVLRRTRRSSVRSGWRQSSAFRSPRASLCWRMAGVCCTSPICS